MRLLQALAQDFDQILLWGLIATASMTLFLELGRTLGLTRMSLPFLFGTSFTGHRRLATALGVALYTLGGWIFSIGYALVFLSLGWSTWWLGAVLGAVHGLFLLIVFLPVLASLHPRMATEHDGPTAARRLEPPGLMGLNYGRQTPIATMVGLTAYGTVLGAFLPPGHSLTASRPRLPIAHHRSLSPVRARFARDCAAAHADILLVETRASSRAPDSAGPRHRTSFSR